MSVTATYNQITSTTVAWIGTFQIGGVYYAIRDPNILYRIETDGTATYLRTISGDVWGAVECDGTYIYRANYNYIFKINPADGSIPCSSLCPGLRCLGIDIAGGRIFGLTNAGALFVFNTNDMTQSYVNNLGAATYGRKMVYINGALYIPVYGGKIIKYVVDTGVTTTLNNSLSAGWLCLDTDGQYIYGTVDGGRIYRIYPDDSTTYEEVLGDNAGRFWYSNTYYNGQIWANAYNGYCYKIVLPIPAVPTSSVTTSTIYRDTAVTLSCSTSGATIKYTTDGTTPSASNGTTYSAPFTISATTTIKFCAIKDGYLTAGADAVLTYADGVTATYTCPNTTQRNYMGLAEVNGTLYTAINYQGIYSVNKSTGAITQIYSEAADWLVMARVGSNLLCTQWNASLKLISTSGTLLKNFGTDSWWGACDDPSDSNVAYAICNKESNQLAKLNISAGTVQYYTITNREYRGIVCLGNYLYACVHMGLIYKIDKTTFTETVLCNESRVWVDMKTDGTYLYSVVSGGQVRRIDVSTGVSEIVLGDPAGDAANRPWQCLEYSSSDKAVWAGIYGWELWKLALPVPAAPTSSVSTSTIYADTAVTLSCSTSGATIKYTTDGTTPSATNGITYSAPFTISATTTIKFCAIKDGYLTAGTDVVLTWAGLFTQLASITGSEYQWIVLGYYNNLLYGVLIDNATTQTISPTLYSINPNTGELTLLSTLTFTPYSMTIGGDKIYLSNLTSRYIREYNLSGTLTNTYECGTSTPYAAIVGIVYVGGKVYAFSGNGQPRTYYFEITPGNTNVSQISFTGVYSASCSTVAWTDGTYAYYASASNVYKVNPATGATVLYGTTSSGSIGLYNTYLSGTVVTRYGTSLYTSKENENYSRLLSYPNPNSISIFYMTNDGTYIYGSSGTGTAKIYKIRVILDTGTPSIYNSGSWKSEQALYVRHNSTWQSANKAFKVKNGLWTRIY